MDIRTLYEMASRAARQAQQALEASGKSACTPWDTFYGYPAFVGEYNGMVPFAWDLVGDEARALFPLIDLKTLMNPMNATGIEARFFAEHMAARLGSFSAYLSTRIGDKDRETDGLVDFLGKNLRAVIFDIPSLEVEVQNALEALLRGRSIDYRREQVTIPYSSKMFRPDFTLEAVETAIEVKLCSAQSKEKQIIDEINGDIPAYQTRYRRLIFVLYDLGYIRDEALFKSGIEDNANVYVLVVKH